MSGDSQNAAATGAPASAAPVAIVPYADLKKVLLSVDVNAVEAVAEDLALRLFTKLEMTNGAEFRTYFKSWDLKEWCIEQGEWHKPKKFILLQWAMQAVENIEEAKKDAEQ